VTAIGQTLAIPDAANPCAHTTEISSPQPRAFHFCVHGVGEPLSWASSTAIDVLRG